MLIIQRAVFVGRLTLPETVEYSDPSGLFTWIRPTLLSCLPLRNLHWNSSTRPIRSISSLHADLVPDAATLSARVTSQGNDGLKDAKRTSSADGGHKERRHQIPGLRRTPYLKIYFFQCDDIDTYRASARQSLRDWVNKQGPSSQSSVNVNKQENHDAHEWLVIHVTGRGTESSTSSGDAKSDPEITKKSSTSRWTSRSSKSVIEKLRLDFNGTSKHAIDRIGQVHLLEQGEPNVADQVSNHGLEDLIAKMKALILASFDLRVQQYEEDIKEKELQRNLPGWNFNTFFVLKEGLARGFESVGLIEDAITGYHELAAGLDAVVEEHLGGDGAEQQTIHFIDSTDDLRQVLNQLCKAVQASSSGFDAPPSDTTDLGSWLLDTDRKPFRNLILENNISIFDFQCYVFARRVALLLRLANAQFGDR